VNIMDAKPDLVNGHRSWSLVRLSLLLGEPKEKIVLAAEGAPPDEKEPRRQTKGRARSRWYSPEVEHPICSEVLASRL